MRWTHRSLASAAVVLALVGVAGAVLAAGRGQTRAVLTEDVLDSMERLLESPVPEPRAGDQRVGSGRFRSEQPCGAVQTSYDGPVVDSTFGWSVTVEIPAGRAAVIGAPSDDGCMYELTAVEPVGIVAPDIEGFEKYRAFAAVACTLSPLSGAVAEFVGPDGSPMVILLAGEVGDLGFGSDDGADTTTTLAELGAEQQGSLQLYSGRYSRDGVGLSQLAALEGTVIDLGDGFVFTSGGTQVTLLCTPSDSTVLVPTDAG